MAEYAKRTKVTPERSEEEIRRALRRYGAENFGTLERTESVTVMFSIRKLAVRIDVRLPRREEFVKSPSGRRATEHVINSRLDQAIRQRWRCLLLGIKAKLEAVENGISTIEQEFMSFIIGPDGRTLGHLLLPRLLEAAESGRMPHLALPGVE